MKSTECPNCYVTVILSTEGICPACHQSTDSPTADRTLTSITVREGQQFPGICFGCGIPVDSVASIQLESSSMFMQLLGGFIRGVLTMLRFFVCGLFALFFKTSNDQNQRLKIRLKVPICSECKRLRRPRVTWMDFNEGIVKLIVPKSVATQISKDTEDTNKKL